MKRILLAIVLFVFLCLAGPGVFAGTPDLSLESIAVNPAVPVPAGAATLTVVVKNVGTAQHRSITLFFAGDEIVLKAFEIPLASSGEHGVTIPALDAGQSKTFTFTKNASLPAGSYSVQASIWPGNKPWAHLPSGPNQESNLSNNQKDLSFKVSAVAANRPGSQKSPHKIPEAEQPTAPRKKPID